MVRNKEINGRATLTREESDQIASDLLPLQVKAGLAQLVERLICNQ